MTINKSAIKFLQSFLKAEKLYRSSIDGIAGRGTLAALAKALTKRGKKAPNGWPSWSNKRKGVCYIQLICKESRCSPGEIDGYWGPSTDHAFDQLQHKQKHGSFPKPWRDVKDPPNPRRWPKERPQSHLTSFYGPPGGSQQTQIISPYQMKIAWNKSQKVTKIGCHKKVASSLERVLKRVLKHYGAEQIARLRLDLYGGCYNKRRKRGGSTWSTHAWGIALDFDPDRNQLRWGRERAAFARPEYDKWWQFWEDEGWISLGRAANFDWMHVQAARR